MKFLSKEQITITDKEKGLVIKMAPLTNEVIFTVYGMLSNSTLVDADAPGSETIMAKLKVAEYLFTNVVTGLSIGGNDIAPLDMLGADFSDDKTSTDFFACLEAIITRILHRLYEDESDVKK